MKYRLKKWLGIGISYHTLQKMNLKKLRIELATKLKPILNKDINGFTQEKHFKTGENIKELFENSEYKGSFADKNESLDIVAIHRHTMLFQINDKDTEVLITLKESVA